MALLNEVSEPLSSRYWKRLMCQSLVERVNCKTGYKMVFLHFVNFIKHILHMQSHFGLYAMILSNFFEA